MDPVLTECDFISIDLFGKAYDLMISHPYHTGYLTAIMVIFQDVPSNYGSSFEGIENIAPKNLLILGDDLVFTHTQRNICLCKLLLVVCLWCKSDFLRSLFRVETFWDNVGGTKDLWKTYGHSSQGSWQGVSGRNGSNRDRKTLLCFPAMRQISDPERSCCFLNSNYQSSQLLGQVSK